MRPPLLAEVFLGGVIHEPALEQAVLGDLAEEWAERVASDGHLEANRWYWCEALRTMPHLLLAWWRATSVADVRRTARAVGAGYLVMAALTTPGEALLAATLGVTPEAHEASAVSLTAQAMLGAVIGFGSGAATARSRRSAPLIGALALAGSYLLLDVTASALLGPTSQPIGYWTSLAAIVPGAVTVSAMGRRVATRDPAALR